MSFLKTMINSIARTFGRIIAYALIGLVIYFIGSKFAFANPQYRMSDLSDNWGEWTNITLGETYTGSTNITTSWSSYIQLKDTTTMESNKSYNLNTSFQIKIIGNGNRDLFSAVVPYVYNGSDLTNVNDKCTISGTKSDTVSSGLLPNTTHIYNANINCVGLKNTGNYPYIIIRFKANQNTLLTSMQLNVSSWNYTIGSDSTDANNIMNNANQNTQNIINGLNDMGDSITYSVNQSTQDITNAINNQNKVCNDNIIYNLEYGNQPTNGYLNSSGQILSHNDIQVSDYLRADSNYTTVVNLSNTYSDAPSICFYDKNKNLLSCESYAYRREFTVQNPTNTYYIRASVRKDVITLITTSYCYDYREKETEQNEEINDNLHNMLTLFSSDSTPSENEVNSILSDINFSDDTPVSNFIMFPIVIFSFFSESMSRTCSPISLGELYGHELQLPCLNLPGLFGATLWNMIDLLFCFFMIYNIVHFFISIFEDVSELRSPFLKFFIKNRGVIEK